MNKLSIVLLLTSLFFLSECRKPTDRIEGKLDRKDNSLSALVVFSVGDSRIIHADLTEEKAVLGSAFKTGDKILTGAKSKVDIQIGKSSAVRLGANTTLEFTQLANSVNGNLDSKLSITTGKIFANISKENKNDSFSISTPTLVAGVRGTSFLIDIKKDEFAMIKVVDGSVAVSPRIPSFEKIPLEELEKNAGLKKIYQSLLGSEVVLEKEQQIELLADDQILLTEKFDTRSIKEIIQRLTDITAEKPVPADFTKTEQQELKTIVFVDPKVATEMIRLNEELSSGRIDEAKAEELEKKRNTLENQVTSKQEVEKVKFNESIVVEPKRLQSNRDIVKYYERIEKIILVNGRTEIGAIINQEDSIMIVHTENGIIRINTNEIVEVVYDFQTKGKF
ncbi:MAG: lipoprotein LipL45 [Leptospiraceae bacterium]|nr:lipoprotein LipL45 [Leptospiraceae bacterium]